MSFRYNKNAARKRKRTVVAPSILLERVSADLDSDSKWLEQSLQLVHDSLPTPHWIEHILCLGLGSPSSSHDSRAQLAFLLKLCDRLNIEHERVSVYDPVFTESDAALFAELKIHRLLGDGDGDDTVIENKNKNRVKHYHVQVPTLLYMPHCEMSLYENVLRENWCTQSLSNTLLLANRLGDYVDNNPYHKLESEFPYLLNLAPHLDSRSLPTSKAYPTAFNNSSIQFVNQTTLDQFSHWGSSISKDTKTANGESTLAPSDSFQSQSV